MTNSDKLRPKFDCKLTDYKDVENIIHKIVRDGYFPKKK